MSPAHQSSPNSLPNHDPHPAAPAAGPEGKSLEFKCDLSSPRHVLKTLEAFANSAGGKLVVGVDDTRQVVGVARCCCLAVNVNSTSPDTWVHCGRFRERDKMLIFDLTGNPRSRARRGARDRAVPEQYAFESVHFGAMQRQNV